MNQYISTGFDEYRKIPTRRNASTNIVRYATMLCLKNEGIERETEQNPNTKMHRGEKCTDREQNTINDQDQERTGIIRKYTYTKSNPNKRMCKYQYNEIVFSDELSKSIRKIYNYSILSNGNGCENYEKGKVWTDSQMDDQFP